MMTEEIRYEDRDGDWSLLKSPLDPNWRGIILDQLQVMEDPLAVTRQILKMEEETGAGITETEAPESTRKQLDESVSWR